MKFKLEIIKNLKKFKFKNFKEQSGTLTPLYVGDHLPNNFKLKRLFFVYGKKKYLRADHAHKKCSQIIFPVIGKVKITTFFKKRKKIFFLDQKKGTALTVPIHAWIRIKFFKDNDCILTACNYKYDKKNIFQILKHF